MTPEQSAAATRPAAVPVASRLAAGITVTLALLGSQVALAVLALAAVVAPVRDLLVAAGAGALVAAGLLWRERATPLVLDRTDAGGELAILIAAAGAVLLAMAFKQRGDERPWWTAAVPLALGAAGVVLAIIVASAAASTVALHHLVRAFPALAILPLALATVLGRRRPVRARATAAAAAACGLLVLIGGAPVALERGSGDLLLTAGRLVKVDTLDEAPLRRVSVGFDVSEVRVSPDGRSLALVAGTTSATTVHVGRIGSELSTYPATTARFLDDDRIVLMTLTRDRTHLRVLDLNSPVPTDCWTLDVRGIRSGQLGVSADRGEWSLLGVGPDRELVRVRGSFDGRVTAREIWPRPASEPSPGWPLAAMDDRVLVVHTKRRAAWLDRWAWWRSLQIKIVGRLESRFSLVQGKTRTPLGTTNLDVHCEASPLDSGEPICAAFDGRQTRFVSIDLQTHTPRARGVLPGRAILNNHGRQGWIAGWWADGVVVVDLDGVTAYRLTGEDRDRAWHIDVGRGIVAAAYYDDPGTTVKVFAVR